MAHFQERRAGGDRRKLSSEDRRNTKERRNHSVDNLEFIERARFKAWVAMTDKTIDD